MESSEQNSESSFKSSSDQQQTGFVNEGLRRWEAIRSEWLRPKQSNGNINSTTTIPQDRIDRDRDLLDSEEILETIFSPNGDWELRQAVPLDYMVDILIDFWETEGLYD